MIKDTKSRYKTLIKKILSENASLREMDELAKLPCVERRMKAQWEEDKDKQLDDQLGLKIWQQIEKGCQKGRMLEKRRLYIRRTIIAACIALIAVAGVYWLKEYMIEVRTPEFIELLADKSRKVVLPDGSRIWIKDGSFIRYKKHFAEDRKVWLEGEAIFEVEKKAGSPFKVFLDASSVEVKGTVFRVVNRKTQPQEVDLFSGKVEFNAETSKRKVALSPYQYLVFIPENDELEVRKMDKVAWQNGKYMFTNMRTDTLIHIISRIYNVPINLTDGIGENEYFNGSIRMNETLDEVLEKICYNLNVNYKIEESRYILYE